MGAVWRNFVDLQRHWSCRCYAERSTRCIKSWWGPCLASHRATGFGSAGREQTAEHLYAIKPSLAGACASRRARGLFICLGPSCMMIICKNEVLVQRDND